jgi:hypothetical protein
MKLTRVCLVALGCVAGAVAFGVVANAAIDLMLPSPSAKALPSVPVKAAEDKPAAEQPATFALASATSTPVDLGPLKIKTVPIVVRDGELIEQVLESSAGSRAAAKVPLPRPRPAAAPHETTASIARQPGSLAISAATRKAAPDEGEALSAANIDRMKMALALTAEQEEFWPAVAAELQAIGKALSHNSKTKGKTKISVDDETKQRLYWAAAPLITRLSYEQKLKAKQMARLMGLNEVAEAL